MLGTVGHTTEIVLSGRQGGKAVGVNGVIEPVWLVLSHPI